MITAFHSIFWDAIVAAVAVHVLAILTYTLVKRHNLLLPMITGWKTLPESVPQPRMAGPAHAIFLFGRSALAAAALANFL
jgi:hypothetical protein